MRARMLAACAALVVIVGLASCDLLLSLPHPAAGTLTAPLAQALVFVPGSSSA
jgi:hypothetical protein